MLHSVIASILTLELNIQHAMSSASSSKPENTNRNHPWPKQKINAITRLKSFSGSLVHPKREPSLVFPPPSWELSDELLGTSTSTPSLLESNFEEPTRVEPVSFAQRLKGLIEALPRQLPGSSKQTPAVSAESLPDDGKQGPPVPAGLDQHLVRLLSSEDIMNGERTSTSDAGDKGSGRIGVWNILAGLRKDGVKNDQNISPGAIEAEEDGVMMYAPLEPKSDSQVELASSEIVLEYVDEHGSSRERTKGPGAEADTSSKQSLSSHANDNAQQERVVEKQIWVPSTTELSVLTTWWGYRLYLPPPVMEKLNGTSMKATARAAMITSALKWLLDKVPITLVPVQFRPAVKMLKQLSPVVGYIGVFIAWSWDRVRALDNGMVYMKAFSNVEINRLPCYLGNGVVLTATWLLPVALVPMTWDAGDIYGPPLPPKSGSNESRADSGKDKASSNDASGENEKPKKTKHFFRW